jgi:hypothetical protein
LEARAGCGVSPADRPEQAALRQLKCRQGFDQVWSLFSDDDRALLLAIVLRNISIGRAAETLGKSKPWTTQRIVAALDRLAEHFGIDASAAACGSSRAAA